MSFTWPDKWPGGQKVPSSIPGKTRFSPLLIFSLTFSLLRSYCRFVLFLCIAQIFLIYKFSPLLYFPFNFLPISRSPSQGPAIHEFLVKVRAGLFEAGLR